MYYKACHKLWNFIYNYNKVGYSVDLLKREPVISKEFEKDIYDSFIWNYAMIHNQVDGAEGININRPKKKKDINIKYIRQVLDEIVRESGIPDENLQRIVMNELTSLQEKYKREEQDRKRVMSKKISNTQSEQKKSG